MLILDKSNVTPVGSHQFYRTITFAYSQRYSIGAVRLFSTDMHRMKESSEWKRGEAGAMEKTD